MFKSKINAKSLKEKEITFAIQMIIIEVVFVVLQAFFTDQDAASSYEIGEGFVRYQPMFQDVNVMIFVGFGFLMTFMHFYSFSAVCINMLLSLFTIQWSILFVNLIEIMWHAKNQSNFKWDLKHLTIKIEIVTLIKSLFACAAVLISMGANLGKLTHTQLLFMGFIEVIIQTINERIGAGEIQALDMGGSIFVHTFGAYFGLGVSKAITKWDTDVDKETSEYTYSPINIDNNYTTKTNDLFSMIGTLFLWMFWPSFNGALAPLEMQAQHRVVINTTLSLSASALSAMIISVFLRGRLSMEDIQNATLAGGVAIGSSSDLVIQPWGAILIGFIAGGISTWGQQQLKYQLEKRLKLHDSCGVNNLHGMPGILGGIGGAISAMFTSDTLQGTNIKHVFPARGPPKNRSSYEQGYAQILALIVTIIVSLLAGFITGLILRNITCFWKHENAFFDELFELNEQENENEQSATNVAKDNFVKLMSFELISEEENKQRIQITKPTIGSPKKFFGKKIEDSSPVYKR